MTLHAVRNIGPAVTVTREFLTPPDIRRWLALAFVVFFVGTGLSFPAIQFNTSGASGPSGEVTVTELPEIIPTDIATLLVVLVVGGVLLGIVFALVGAIMEFVLIESLRTGDVAVRRYWGNRWRQGLRLFGFRIAIGIPVLVVFIGWVALLVVPVFTGLSIAVPFAVFLLGIPVLLVVGLLYGLVSGFTTVFVVPLMIQRDSAVLPAWRRLWDSIKDAWKQYLAYAVIGYLLTIGAGLLASIVVGIVAFVVLVPLVGVGVVTHVAISLTSTAGLVVLVGLGLVFAALMLVLWALVQVPIVTYLRYYALLVLGDIDESFDIIPDQRRAISD